MRITLYLSMSRFKIDVTYLFSEWSTEKSVYYADYGHKFQDCESLERKNKKIKKIEKSESLNVGHKCCECIVSPQCICRVRWHFEF